MFDQNFLFCYKSLLIDSFICTRSCDVCQSNPLYLVQYDKLSNTPVVL